MTVNYQLELDKKLAELCETGRRPRLLLHSCCGPCSSYVLEYLSKYFDMGLFYYNPNIWPPEEYEKRRSEQLRLLKIAPFAAGVVELPSDYETDVFDEAVTGLEGEPEGGARCTVCFRLRLEASAAAAKKNGFDLFTTTLSVSPHKNAPLINELGRKIGEKHGVEYLCADFKKRNGYKRSIELSKEYGLYRQIYCGCRYSMRSP